MANVKSIGGNPIVLGLDGLTDEAKSELGNGTLCAAAESLLGDASTAQWATRASAGSGAAKVESVQGATVAWNQLAYGGLNDTSWRVSNGAKTVSNNELTATAESDSVWLMLIRAEWIGTSQPDPIEQGHKYLLRVEAMGSGGSFNAGLSSGNSIVDTFVYAQTLTSDFAWYKGIATSTANSGRMLVISMSLATTGDYFTVRNIQLFDLTQMFGAGNEPATVEEFEAMFPAAYYPYSAPTLKPVRIAGIQSTDANGDALDSVEWGTQTLRAAGSVADMLYSDHVDVKVGERAYQSGDESDATVRTDGTTTYYPLAEPTTTPISPALPMTYRVEQGGTEAIVVPAGVISAAPLITLAQGETSAELIMDALACIAAPDGPTATANHAINTYLTMGGKLYKVTSAIAVGEAIKAGTNVTETTVMAELIARTA